MRVAWRWDQAERERAWALASARAEGVSVRTLARAAGLSPSRVHQLVTAVDLAEAETARAELRAADWPCPENPDEEDDPELTGRDAVADRLCDEVAWLVQLDTGRYPPGVNPGCEEHRNDRQR